MILKKYIEPMGQSKPIFVLTLNGDRIEKNVMEPYKPSPIEGDPISALVCSAYAESFNGAEFVKDIKSMRSNCVGAVQGIFKQFIRDYGGFKAYKTSSIYRYIDNMNGFRQYNGNDNTNSLTEEQEGLLLLYQYAMKHSASTSRIHITTANTKVIDNTIAILSAMKEKYEKK